MRNCETVIFDIPYAVFKSFYSTYEELKQHILNNKAGNGFCFHSTYEELKTHSDVAGFFKSCDVFHSTYEELKLLDLVGPVFMLDLVLQYLWGIETVGPCWSCFYVGPCFTVPMRNWTSTRQTKITIYTMFTVPMRNWNFLSTKLYPFPVVFTVPMRNWTLLKLTVKVIFFRFLQYLWGIETSFCFSV